MAKDKILIILFICLIVLLSVDIGVRLFKPRVAIAEWKSSSSSTTDSERLASLSNSLDKIADSLNGVEDALDNIASGQSQLKTMNYSIKDINSTLKDINRSIERIK
ncbi:hypothetical protein KAU33_07490 [Candidatus Dependentiae bacterium]|nr:hypothetical protein [Candidatus Dependentiae bacterium]